jgi:hypothetical protein
MLPSFCKHFVTSILVLLVSLTLTGCVDAKTSIHFDRPQQGQLTQHIKLGSQLATAQGWLNQLEGKARRLHGQVDRVSGQELNFVVPFYGAQDLATKFNQLFSFPEQSSSAQLTVSSSNLLLLDRQRLTYDIDLSALGVQDDQGQMLLNAGSAIDLGFRVSGPWGDRVFTLKPGQKNHLEAVLWMPNPIGWGALLIGALVFAGTYYSRQNSRQNP